MLTMKASAKQQAYGDLDDLFGSDISPELQGVLGEMIGGESSARGGMISSDEDLEKLEKMQADRKKIKELPNKRGRSDAVHWLSVKEKWAASPLFTPTLKIRLESIDTPEANQPYGNKAKEATSALLIGKDVEIWKTGEDFFKRTLAFVVADGVNATEHLLRIGLAWHYKEYSKDPQLAELESQAREIKIGLWGGSEEPIAPWAWRR